ncbi:MAG TPA: cell division protein FtsZ, partial [Deltaproteobacteria bacterium]|nr:cell division protein FtsZ [Deltaproteobacteria bacterium]
MGGGTGTGASPVVARVAREMGVLTVAVVIKPFSFEGKLKMTKAEAGEKELAASVDAIIAIPNDRLLSTAGDQTMMNAFKTADNILLDAVRGISEVMSNTGLVNVDFNDVKNIMKEKGKALMGIGRATGPNRAAEAAQSAISSPLLEDMDIHGAKGILINITADQSLTMNEVHEASSIIRAAAHEEADIKWGVVIDEAAGEEMSITVIATGFASKPVVLSSGIEKGKVHQTQRDAQSATVVDYSKPAYMRKKEEKEKEVIRLGMVVDDSVLDQELAKFPPFLRKKAD